MMPSQTLSRSILLVAGLTILILMIPYIAMQFTNEVKWDAVDFTIMGVLIFSTGLAFVMIFRSGAQHLTYRIGMGLAIIATFLMVWVNLAVGLIGAGPNLGNLLYIVVVAVAVIGMFVSKFKAGGMEIAMYATTVALIALPAFALITHMYEYAGSSVTEILGGAGFFASLYIISGLLFRFASDHQATAR